MKKILGFLTALCVAQSVSAVEISEKDRFADPRLLAFQAAQQFANSVGCPMLDSGDINNIVLPLKGYGANKDYDPSEFSYVVSYGTDIGCMGGSGTFWNVLTKVDLHPWNGIDAKEGYSRAVVDLGNNDLLGQLKYPKGMGEFNSRFFDSIKREGDKFIIVAGYWTTHGANCCADEYSRYEVRVSDLQVLSQTVVRKNQ